MKLFKILVAANRTKIAAKIVSLAHTYVGSTVKSVLLLALLISNVMVHAQEMSMVYYKGKVYSDASHLYPLPTIEVEQAMYKQSVILYNQYKSGINMKAAGSAFIGIGVPALAVSIILIPITYSQREYYRGYYYYDKKMYESGWSLFGIGLGLTAMGIPIYSVGIHKIERSVNAYNLLKHQDIARLSFSIKDNGLGIAMTF